MPLPPSDPPSHRPDAGGVPSAARPAEGALLCPFLVSVDGPWRRPGVHRLHRCRAVAPATTVPSATQRRFCLSGAHTTCPAYRSAEERLGGSVEHPVGTRWPLPIPAATVVDPGPPWGGLSASPPLRLASQVGFAALVIAAAGVFVAGRLVSGIPAGGERETPFPTGISSLPAAVLPSPSAAEGSAATETPSVTETPPVGSSSPVATPGATPIASAAPTSGYRTTYTVRPGDTLSAIAARYGTTVQAIAELNGIENPSLIRVGQVLRIP
jgi:nucleoid-associated protein YgaU